jgi:glucose/arabinose dehydrogenase
MLSATIGEDTLKPFHSSVLRAAAAISALALGCGASLAQTPAAAPTATPATTTATTTATPAIPPTWAQGRTADQLALNLAPHPPGLTALDAAEIPVADLKVPAGFKVELWASGAPNARSMTFGSKGTLFVGTRFVGNVYAVVERDGKRQVKTIAKGLHRPNGVAFKDGALYVAELSRILRYDDIENRLDNPPAPVVVFDQLPKDEPHGWKYMVLGPDGHLYFQIGSPGNILMPPASHATINRLNLKTMKLEIVAAGVRNSVGMAFHPRTQELWFTNNARDWVNDELPNDTLHRVPQKGAHFGFPYCHQGDLPDPEFGQGRDCAQFEQPVALLGPHVAALGMRFYTGNSFPAIYRDQVFIAEHGSWNRSKKSGFQVVSVALDAQGKASAPKPFITGWAKGEGFWGRPADVQLMADGSMLVSDDVAGAIFRVSAVK